MQTSSFKAKSRLIISKEVQSQIMFLHNKIGDIEWSGLLFYSIVSGDISEPETLVLRTEKIYLMDIGVAAYTEFTPDETIVDFYDKYPESMTQKWGLIHTHHNMNTFFSGTDTDELKDNAGSHNFYLSLIVNHKSDFCAKIGIIAEVEQEVKNKFTFSFGLSFKDLVNNERTETKKDKQLLTIDCIIEFEQGDFEVARYNSIKATKDEANKKKYSGGYNHFPGQGKLFNEVGFDKQTKLLKHESNTIYIPKTRNEIEKFLSDLWSMSANNKKLLVDVLKEIDTCYQKDKNQFEALYFDGVSYAIDETYYKSFGKYLMPEHENKFFKQCILVMDNYRILGLDLHDKMIDFLDFYMEGEEEVPDFPEYNGELKEEKRDKKVHKFGSDIDQLVEKGNKILGKFYDIHKKDKGKKK